MDILYTSKLHRDLYQRVPLDDDNKSLAIWHSFVTKYPSFKKFGLDWTMSRRSGNSPINIGIPWINYHALNYVNNFIKEDKRIFEWGMGGSTIFFRGKSSLVISCEHDENWFKEVSEFFDPKSSESQHFSVLIKPEQTSKHEGGARSGLQEWRDFSFEKYVTFINGYPDEYFHCVLIDGRCRNFCLANSFRKVMSGGIIIFDNSDYMRYQEDIKSIERDYLSGWERIDYLSPGPCSRVIGWKTTIWKRP
jgi:hypothetical protein